MRRPAALIGLWGLFTASVAFAVPANNILVSGQTVMAYIDGNGNGPDSQDCRFTGTTDSMGNFTISPVQDANTPLRACSGMYMGNVDPSFPTDTSVFGKFLTSTVMPGLGFPNLPFAFDGTFLPPDGGPRKVSSVVLTNGNEAVVGSGTLANGMSMFVGLGTGTPGFVKVPKVPFEKADLSGFVMEDVYIPESNGAINFSLASDPTAILIQILLSGTCARPAPTLTEWNVMMLAVLLLIAGTWTLSRRRKFSEALPLP